MLVPSNESGSKQSSTKKMHQSSPALRMSKNGRDKAEEVKILTTGGDSSDAGLRYIYNTGGDSSNKESRPYDIVSDLDTNPLLKGDVDIKDQDAEDSGDSDMFASSDEDDEMTESTYDKYSAYTAETVANANDAWKPRSETTYECLALTQTEMNSKVRGCGFRTDNEPRQVKYGCQLSDIRRRCVQREKNPALAICITMYNEDEKELKTTLKGIIHNYNCFRSADSQSKMQDVKRATEAAKRVSPDEFAPLPLIEPEQKKRYGLTKDDFCITIICDGYDRIPQSFKDFARQKGFLDEELLVANGTMTKDEKGVYKMKDLRDVMDKDIAPSDIPKNILHMWQVTTWDLGLEDDILKGRRMHITFAVKHRNDGKINSHKWFFQGICKYLKPDLCLMLDIGTRMDDYALLKLYAHMEADVNCGGCCGEIEVDLDTPNEGGMGTFLLQAAQFFEYKLGHTPDKACESFFGFTQVLPGAYSLFRWKAIKGEPLDAFFKNVTRSKDDIPTCSEANEYLAEDRIMCLQIYIKKLDKYNLAYVPDAKAFTDAPQSMMILMKQRRRWMNGAMFGTYKVLGNFVNMTSCKRTKHGCCRKIGMIIFMFYLGSLYVLQFFIVGAMFAAIYAFFNQVFASIFAQNVHFQKLYYDGILLNSFVYIYIMLLAMCLILSLALPLDRAKPCFIIATTLFGLLTISAIVGMMFYLTAAGFMPEHMTFDKYAWTWVPQGDYNFSWLVLAGVIMLAIYAIPFVLRPIDFLENFKGYTVGLISYLILIPMFTNIFSVYSMANLHDISWGNRPDTTAGAEAITDNIQKQKETEMNYKAYRANFLFLWLCANGAYFVLVLELGSVGDQFDVNSGKFTVLDGFSMYLAGIVIFRVLFAFLYVVKWQIRYWRSPKYQIEEYNLENEFKQLKKNKANAESSDDLEDLQYQQQFALRHKKTLKKQAKRLRRASDKQKISKREQREETKRMILEADMKSNMDSDDDRLDFIDPAQEEQNDVIVKAYRKMGRKLHASEIDHISRGNLEYMNESILSTCMVRQDFQYIQSHADLGTSRPTSRRIMIKSLAESQRSNFTAQKSQTHSHQHGFSEVPQMLQVAHRNKNSTVIDQYATPLSDTSQNISPTVLNVMDLSLVNPMNKSAEEVVKVHTFRKAKNDESGEISFGDSARQSSAMSASGGNPLPHSLSGSAVMNVVDDRETLSKIQEVDPRFEASTVTGVQVAGRSTANLNNPNNTKNSHVGSAFGRGLENISEEALTPTQSREFGRVSLDLMKKAAK